ncbi:MAG TPA: family 1 encapsulin nanocompartment shell protein [Candidatus Obscuribacterales bacterium]
MTEFRQHLAPLSAKDWDLVQGQARDTLAKQLAGRRVVDVKGPMGMQYHGVGTGRLKTCQLPDHADVSAGIRQILPMLEVRKSFQLELEEFDALARGAQDIDLDPLVEAAKSLATLEDRIVFHGLEQAGIQGMIQATPLTPQNLASDSGQFMQDLATGIGRLRTETVEGSPTDNFHLVLSPELRRFISSQYIGSHSLRQEILKLIGGQIYTSNALGQALLVNAGSGHYELTLAQDFTLGYEHHDADSVSLFLMEAFTFQVLNPEASLLLTTG